MDEVYHICPTSPLHLGDRGVGMEESEVYVPSDTLFSAICWAIREVEGTGWLNEWLAAFLAGTAPLVITSAFPRAGEVRFYPRLALPVPGFSEREEAGRAPEEAPGRQIKDVRYVSEDLFGRWLAGRDLSGEAVKEGVLPGGLWASAADRERLPDGVREVWSGPDAVPHAALDRVSNSSALFHVGEVRFAKECGLWFGVRWRDRAWRDSVWRDLLTAALNCLGEAGVGGERSAGRGQFRWSRLEVDRFPGSPAADRAVTLSLYHPTRAEVEAGRLDGARYRLRTRRGWLASAEGQGWRSRSVRMLGEGSVIPAGDAGDLVDVTPAGFGDHRVYRYGLAFPVGTEVAADG